MDHFKILKRAWTIVWKYRALLLVGLILVLAGGAVGGVNVPTGGSPGGSGSSSGSSGDGGHLPSWDVVWDEIAPYVMVGMIILAILLVLGLLLAIVKLVLRYVTRAALIKMVDRYEEREEQIGFMEALRLGWRGPTARQMFLTRLILALPMIVLGLFVFLAIIVSVGIIALIIINATAGGREPGGAAIAISFVISIFFMFIVLMPTIIIGALLRMVLAVIQEIAFRVCALQGLKAWDAIREAVGLIRRNLWPTVLQALLMIGLGIAWNVLLMVVNVPLALLALFIASVPSLLVGGIVALTMSPIGAVIIGLIILVLVMVVVLGLPNLVFSTFATVYYSTVWTLTYRELRVIDVGDAGELIEVKADLE